MELATVIKEVLEPAFSLLPTAMDNARARVMLLAIGQQESRFVFRLQLGGGPAKGFWQFEKNGGVKGIYFHVSSRALLEKVCQSRNVPFAIQNIYDALETDDVLAACCARLLLYTDPKSLPTVGDSISGWALYERVWRPGKPHPETWPEYHQRAREALGYN